MNLALVGINHRTAPIEVRERMNIEESRLADALTDLVRRDGILEGLILSTCNRVEVVTSAQENLDAEPIIHEFLAEHHHCDLGPYEPHFYRHRQQEVVRHLFRVASSLDSMIVGEPQILGQMKQACAVARRVGALGGTLAEVAQQALAVARKVRRETAIGSAAVSVSYAAVELARKIFGSLEGKAVFLIGAGKMSELAAKHLLRSGASPIFVANRTPERAVELAQAFHGTAVRFEELFEVLPKADVVISSAGAPHFIVGKEQAERLAAARRSRPIFFVDIAVPRNIDPAVNEVDNVFVYDIDDLQQVVDANKKQRERDAAWAEEIVREEVRKTMRRLASRDLVPTIVALEKRLNLIRENELDRLKGRLGALTPEQHEAVDTLTRGIINKILHGPLQELKSRAGEPEQGTFVQFIRRIFGLE